MAGCTGDTDNQNGDRPNGQSDSDEDGVPDSQDAYPNDSRFSKQVLSKSNTWEIEEDRWRYFGFSLRGEGKLYYDFIVREGPEIDVILMDESEYTHFESQSRYNYYTKFSQLNSAGGTVEQVLPAGSYYIIFDNSEAGEASPPTDFNNSVATVEFDIEVGSS